MNESLVGFDRNNMYKGTRSIELDVMQTLCKKAQDFEPFSYYEREFVADVYYRETEALKKQGLDVACDAFGIAVCGLEGLPEDYQVLSTLHAVSKGIPADLELLDLGYKTELLERYRQVNRLFLMERGKREPDLAFRDYHLIRTEMQSLRSDMDRLGEDDSFKRKHCEKDFDILGRLKVFACQELGLGSDFLELP